MLLPTKARYAPGDPVMLELEPLPTPGLVTVSRLGDEVVRVAVPPGGAAVSLGALPAGGYAVTLSAADGAALSQSAVEVLADPVTRMRYGFVASFAPGRDIDPVLRNFRRLHLTAAQFYDWAYRHANLVGPDEVWSDPLGQPVALATVRAFSVGFRAAGTLPLGYAAVYGVGKHEWPDWQHTALLDASGTPYQLADFLSIVDPSDPGWLAHFRRDLHRAVKEAGFAGFHLDQYGFPRRAVRPDGAVVDLGAAFDTVIREVRDELPEACLVFNNVNDFPVWVTTRSPQDVTYTEVWEPHATLADLAAVATRSRSLAPDRPAVLAAYQSVYADHQVEQADAATRLTMATLFSHGATQLLAGESGNVLVDPYYVRNHAATPATLDLLARWYDLLVAAGDILFPATQADITRSVAGSLNGELEVLTEGVIVSHDARAGVIWRRVVETPLGTVVHLINLVGQTETGWDTPKAPIPPITGLRLKLRQTGSEIVRLHAADPDRAATFDEVTVTAADGHLYADLPPLRAWQLLLIRHGNTEENR